MTAKITENELLKVQLSEERQAFLAEQVAGQESRAELAESQAENAKLVEALQQADLYLNNFDTSKPSRIKAETRAIVAEALAL
jgi:hypothetical protein